MSTETTETLESKDVAYENKAQQLLELAYLAPMKWATKFEQPAETDAAAKASQSTARDTAPVSDNNAEAQEAADGIAVVDLSQNDQTSVGGAHGAHMVGSENDLEDDIAVCWDMAEQLEGDADNVQNTELSTAIKQVVDLLKAVKTPNQVAFAKIIAKLVQVALANSGGGDDVGNGELPLAQKLLLIAQLREMEEKASDIADKLIDETNAELAANPNHFTAEGKAAFKEWEVQTKKYKEERKKRDEEYDKAMKEAEGDVKKQEELTDRYIKEKKEAYDRQQLSTEELKQKMNAELTKGTPEQQKATQEFLDKEKNYEVEFANQQTVYAKINQKSSTVNKVESKELNDVIEDKDADLKAADKVKANASELDWAKQQKKISSIETITSEKITSFGSGELPSWMKADQADSIKEEKTVKLAKETTKDKGLKEGKQDVASVDTGELPSWMKAGAAEPSKEEKAEKLAKETLKDKEPKIGQGEEVASTDLGKLPAWVKAGATVKQTRSLS